MTNRPDRPTSRALPRDHVSTLLLSWSPEARERSRELADEFLAQRERFRAQLAKQTVLTFESQIRQGGSRHGKLSALELLSALHDLEAVLRQHISVTVSECRARKASWAQIGESLAVTRQAAHHRFTSAAYNREAAG
jgi:hypothetical protein